MSCQRTVFQPAFLATFLCSVFKGDGVQMCLASVDCNGSYIATEPIVLFPESLCLSLTISPCFCLYLFIFLSFGCCCCCVLFFFGGGRGAWGLNKCVIVILWVIETVSEKFYTMTPVVF